VALTRYILIYYLAELFAVLIRIKAVLITLSVVAGKSRRLLSTFILFDFYVICDANFDCKDTQIIVNREKNDTWFDKM